jgi:hypothetical protein
MNPHYESVGVIMNKFLHMDVTIRHTNAENAMEINIIFNRIWRDYVARTPSAKKIVDLFAREGEVIVNDHIAFRTLDYPGIGIDVIARPFVQNGYVAMADYEFADKHLFARHFEVPGNPGMPRVFISQLLLSEFSDYLRKSLTTELESLPPEMFDSANLIFSGSFIKPLSYEVYSALRNESEYAAWFYVFGFRANHFTVNVNALKKYNHILKVNQLLRKNGFVLNSSGGEVKGTESDLLQQSSTLADIIPVEFVEGTFGIPSCYYEFAQRYPMPDGKLFSGFVARSADKIFESTDFYKRTK